MSFHGWKDLLESRRFACLKDVGGVRNEAGRIVKIVREWRDVGGRRLPLRSRPPLERVSMTTDELELMRELLGDEVEAVERVGFWAEVYTLR